MLLPYKLLYAAQLAEHGLISEAAQYCGAIQQALGAVPKLPPGLAVCRAFTQDLLERLHTYAAVSRKEKRGGKTTPFGVNLMRSPV